MSLEEQNRIINIIISELRAIGATRISIFGSFARNESFRDIDVLVRFDPSAKKKLGLSWVGVGQELSKKIGIPVDLVTEESLPKTLYRFVNPDLKVVYDKAG